jgi:hypothetical protein
VRLRYADRLLGDRFFGPCFLEAEEPGKVGVQRVLTRA